MSGLIDAANHDPRLTRVFSTFTATNPSIYLDIDRDKAQALGLNMSDVFTALQSTLGGILRQQLQPVRPHLAGQRTGRSRRPWRYFRYLADPRTQQQRRDGADALDRQLRIVTGPQVITRYNNYRSVTINGGPAAGVSSGTAIAAMEEVSRSTLPAGYAFEWTGTAYQEHEAPGRPA